MQRARCARPGGGQYAQVGLPQASWPAGWCASGCQRDSRCQGVLQQPGHSVPRGDHRAVGARLYLGSSAQAGWGHHSGHDLHARDWDGRLRVQYPGRGGTQESAQPWALCWGFVFGKCECCCFRYRAYCGWSRWRRQHQNSGRAVWGLWHQAFFCSRPRSARPHCRAVRPHRGNNSGHLPCVSCHERTGRLFTCVEKSAKPSRHWFRSDKQPQGCQGWGLP
mmetsp:Transcript_23353/g.54305  ORF Transcript_23353/g.54305 Transcript_23353/m.54305 type:complete len:221 (+) Transcript_23353:617-1279(+)